MVSKKVIIYASLIFALFLVIIIGLAWFKAHPKITIQSDSSPFALQLNDMTYNIKTNQASIRPFKGIYNYKATSIIEGKTITQYGSVDTLDNINNKISISFTLYTKGAIKKALCSNQNISQYYCGESYSPNKVDFVDENSWAIAYVTPSDELGPSIDILQLVNGSWQLSAGPFGHAADFQGLIPADVQGAIQQ